MKKVKRTIPAWASVTASKKLPVSNFAGTHHRVDDILIEALEVGIAVAVPGSAQNRPGPFTFVVGLPLQSANSRSGVSYQAVLKFIVKKYPEMELKKRKFLIRKALKKHLEKGTIKQVDGGGDSSF